MNASEKVFTAGEVIFREGDAGNSFYRILDGDVGVYINYGTDDQLKLVVLKPGQFFGEMAVIESYPRSTTVVAEDEVRAIEVPEEGLTEYFAEDPDTILAIMKHIGTRLKGLTKDYNDAKFLLAEIQDAKVDKKSESVASKVKKFFDVYTSGKNNPGKPSAESIREQSIGLTKEDSTSAETYSKGTVIFREGEFGNCMYAVYGGTVGIYSNYGEANEVKLTELYPVSFFGEMGMIAEEARSATAVAASDDTFVEIIRPEELKEMFKTSPVKVEMILRHLSYRLRSLTYDYYNTCKEIYDAYNK
ncbi:MAG: cyclic nucleotide-binding domain-containing protein [Clostridiales bacterium]|nr:cyclic nucleotide-binding domain-containing protein [Clostridiales bacterium]